MTAEVLERTIDVDAHEMAPEHLWGEIYGDAAHRISELIAPFTRNEAALSVNSLFAPDASDTMPITDENVWNVRGLTAPSAFDFGRRLEVMDVMGIQKQLVFPSWALFAVQLMLDDSFLLRGVGQDQMSRAELLEVCRAGLDEYNDWCVRTTALDPDRLRAVAYLAPAATPEPIVEQAEDLVSRGIRAVHIECGIPPGGHSPGHPSLDPLWELLAANDVACTTHVGGDGDFKRTNAWLDAPAFQPGKVKSHELGLEPYSFATLHFAPSNFLTCMTLGGVFERFPTLRFGVIELGAHWFGPLARSLDMWEREVYHSRLSKFISMRPSEYFRRNVRVTPYSDIEPVEEYLVQYPELRECYCYSSDFPHMEGGKDVARRLHARLEQLGEDIVEDYFVNNGRLLLPDR